MFFLQCLNLPILLDIFVPIAASLQPGKWLTPISKTVGFSHTDSASFCVFSGLGMAYVGVSMRQARYPQVPQPIERR